MFVIVENFQLNNFNVIRPGVSRLLTASELCGSRRRAEIPEFQGVYGRKKLSSARKCTSIMHISPGRRVVRVLPNIIYF